ncbi:MAG: hypothetical protein IIT53_16445, partial [Fibrobacter sp.]|nr:hypothetical protein [Fibrobacter sp.]
MKRLPMLLIPCIAISATAATFNAQGKIINSKDAENPGIVKFEKDKIATTKNNLKKPTALAKIEPMTNVIHVTPYEGRFSTNNNSYSLILNGNNLNISTQQQYINTINTLETLDEPRNRGLGFGESNSGYPYSYSNGSDCRITSTSYNYNAFFNDVYTDILNGLHFNPGTTPTHSCTGTYSNTCGNGINIYNVVADRHPITFNGNSCKITDPNDARHALNYSYRIQHYNVNQFFSVASPNASLYTVAEREARSDGHFMTDKFPWHFFNSQETINKAPHIIN